MILFVALVGAGPIVPGQLGAQPQFPNPAYEVGFSPFGLVKADFDGDGIADLVASNFGSFDPGPEIPGSLSFLRGLGDGTFQEAVHIPALSHPGDVFAADVNGDGRADLLLSSCPGVDDGLISLRLNLGGGAFGPEQVLAAGADFHLEIGDFNGDGRVDLLLLTRDGQFYVAVMFGNGDGSFVQAPTIPLGDVIGLMVADLNGDGRDDLGTMSGGPIVPRNDFLTFLSRGDGAFDAGPSVPLPEFGWWPLPVDLDGDGFVDLAVSTLHIEGDTAPTGPFLTFFGHGDGTFEPGPAILAATVHDVEAVDVNRDGITDLLALDEGNFNVLLGNGDRTWSPAGGPVRSGASFEMVVGDWERDGLFDVALVDGFASAIFTFSGNGDGTFGPRPIASLSGAVLKGMATGDFNGDGRLDIVAGRYALDDVAVVLGNGDGTFGAEALYPAGIGPREVAVADFNRDGRSDLAVLDANWHDFPPYSVIEGSLSILFGNGDGTFGAPVQYPTVGGLGLPVQFPSGGVALWLAVGDVNGDGAPDAVVANGHGSGTEASDLAVFLNDGTGALAISTILALDVADYFPYGWTFPSALAVGDVTGDGHADIAVAILGLPWVEPTPIPGKLMLIPGNGDGTFQPGITVVEGENPGGVAMGDLNRDGRADLVLADGDFFLAYPPGTVQVILAGPGGSFQPLERVPAGTGPWGLGIADLNGDLIPDLAVSSGVGYLAVMPGLGDGTFGTRTNYGLFGRTLMPSIQGDFTSDGLNDLVVATEVGMFVLPNRTTQHVEVTATISFNNPQGRGSGLISWTTDSERDVRGFNVVVIDSRGRRQINSALIPCEQCTTGLGASYSTLLPKHKGGHNLFIEVVHRNGRVDTFGPARRE